MLYKETIPPFLCETLKKLMGINELNDYVLVGGTALSLLIGHRKSVDIDLFSSTYREGFELIPILKKYFHRTEIRDLGFGITMYLYSSDSNVELKVDIMSNEQFIRPIQVIDNIRIASIEDIAAMKLEAITTRLEKKDYWDIAELLFKFSFYDMFEFYKQRYPWNDLRGVIEKITLIDKCDTQPDPITINSNTWLVLKDRIMSSFDDYISQVKM